MTNRPDELSYWIWQDHPPRTGLLGIVVAPRGARSITWDRTRPGWEYDRKSFETAIARAGTTPVDRLDPGRPVQAIDRATAEQIAQRLTGRPLPAEAEITEICDAGIRSLPGGR